MQWGSVITRREKSIFCIEIATRISQVSKAKFLFMIYDIQKASMLKRISAFLLDFILICILAVGVAYLVSVICDYSSYYDHVMETVEVVGKEYNVDLSLTQAEAEEKYNTTDYAKYIGAYNEVLKRCGDSYVMMISLSIMMISIGLFVSYVVLEFVVPLCLKNGQTVGKKIFQIGVVQNNCVKLAPQSLFVLAILGKFAVETMLPLLGLFLIMFNIAPFLGVMLIFGVIVAQITLLIVNKNHCLIHDLLASAVPVNMATQMVFDSEAELVAYKEQIAQERAERMKY